MDPGSNHGAVATAAKPGSNRSSATSNWTTFKSLQVSPTSATFATGEQPSMGSAPVSATSPRSLSAEWFAAHQPQQQQQQLYPVSELPAESSQIHQMPVDEKVHELGENDRRSYDCDDERRPADEDDGRGRMGKLGRGPSRATAGETRPARGVPGEHIEGRADRSAGPGGARLCRE